ncbi:MAG: GIY-YIG nuclease family protein [Bacteroidetes bacterium]|nr:GIY-YIG nuclease family protein [Bacteroidota bacterium]
MVTIYVISCLAAKKKYVGMTENIDQRLKDHNSGASKFTSGYGPWVLIYSETAEDFARARVREKYLKSAAGRRFIKKVESSPPA